MQTCESLGILTFDFSVSLLCLLWKPLFQYIPGLELSVFYQLCIKGQPTTNTVGWFYHQKLEGANSGNVKCMWAVFVSSSQAMFHKDFLYRFSEFDYLASKS